VFESPAWCMTIEPTSTFSLAACCCSIIASS
jgi:hypothetical protein